MAVAVATWVFTYPNMVLVAVTQKPPIQPPFFARPTPSRPHTHPFHSSPLLPSPPFLGRFQLQAGINLYLLQRALWWNEGLDLCLALRVR